MVCDRLATRFGGDWPYEMQDNEEDPCVEPDEAWLSRSALCSLARTCRYFHAVVEPWLYGTVRLTSGRSAFLLWDTLCRAPRLQRCIRNLDATGPIGEQTCRTAVERFAGDPNRRGTCEGLFDADSARLHEEPIAWYDAVHFRLCLFMNEPLAFFHEKDPACEDCILRGPRPECAPCNEMPRPLLATTIVAGILGCLPALRAVRINDHFIPHSGAYEMLKQALHHLAPQSTMSQLSTVVVVGGRDVGVAGPVPDWIGLLRRFSATDIERVLVAMTQLPLPPRIRSLHLSYTDISTWFSNLLHLADLTELAFYPGGCQPEKIRWGRWDAYLPETLQSLRFDTGHHPYVSTQDSTDEDPELSTLYAPCTRSLLRMTQLADLQVPLGLCFRDPDAMAGSSVPELLPPSLRKLTLMEVWRESHPFSFADRSAYGAKVASFLDRVLRDTPGLEELRFQEQWPYWRHARAEQGQGLPGGGSVDFRVSYLFPETATSLAKRAAAYRAERRQHEALEMALRAVELHPGHRPALICLAQIRTGLGEAAAALGIFSRMEPPAPDPITKPARDMRDRLSAAEKLLQDGTEPGRVLRYLEEATKGLVDQQAQPREWLMMRITAQLQRGQYEAALEGAGEILRQNRFDSEALVLAGVATFSLGKPEPAAEYFRRATCCDPSSVDAATWLERAGATT